MLVLGLFSCKHESRLNSVSGKSEIPYWADVNAYYVAKISSDGRVTEYANGICTNGNPVGQNTIFEAASLSKTVFAATFWEMAKSNTSIREDVLALTYKENINEKVQRSFSPFQLLSHTSGITGWDSASNEYNLPDPMQIGQFSYSEAGYILLQKALEKKLAINLESMASTFVFRPAGLNVSSFIWNYSSADFVNGYVENGLFQRNIYHFLHPYANGTLYTTGADLVNFTRYLLHSDALDSMIQPVVSIPGYANLFWGRGIGLEKFNGKTYAWQWGSNWCFTSFLLINPIEKTACVCLTNSVIGAARIHGFIRDIVGDEMQCFQYISW